MMGELGLRLLFATFAFGLGAFSFARSCRAPIAVDEGVPRRTGAIGQRPHLLMIRVASLLLMAAGSTQVVSILFRYLHS